jgi:hypothetical protein
MISDQARQAKQLEETEVLKKRFSEVLESSDCGKEL